jgi:hypothetical protein
LTLLPLYLYLIVIDRKPTCFHESSMINAFAGVARK